MFVLIFLIYKKSDKTSKQHQIKKKILKTNIFIDMIIVKMEKEELQFP